VVVGAFHQDVDFGEADLDSDADAARAIGSSELAIALRNRWRLQDADGFMLAARATSDISPGWILRGLLALALRVRGSTRRNSI
jgi:hypothetical protein